MIYFLLVEYLFKGLHKLMTIATKLSLILIYVRREDSSVVLNMLLGIKE